MTTSVWICEGLLATSQHGTWNCSRSMYEGEREFILRYQIKSKRLQDVAHSFSQPTLTGPSWSPMRTTLIPSEGSVPMITNFLLGPLLKGSSMSQNHPTEDQAQRIMNLLRMFLNHSQTIAVLQKYNCMGKIAKKMLEGKGNRFLVGR